MSRNTIALYNAHRTARTNPPPAMSSIAADLLVRENELRTLAQGLLAQANDLARIRAALEGK